MKTRFYLCIQCDKRRMHIETM